LTRPHRADNPDTAANDLVLRHQDIGKAVAANLPRLHGPPQGGPGADRNGGQRPVGLRRANGEVQHFLRDLGLFVKVPPSWRELRARERKLQGTSVVREALAQRLGGWSWGRAAAMAIDGELGCVGWPCGPDAIS
jgi:hypothetical protein